MIKMIVALILIVPTIEVFLFVLSGKAFGVIPTLSLILLTGVLGGWLAKNQGMKTWGEFQRQLQYGNMPGEPLLDGACILAGGILLLTPGFFTDILGLLLLLPVTRKVWKKMIKKWLKKKLSNGDVIFNFRRF